MTDYVCHTAPVENAVNIFKCGSLQVPTKWRDVSALVLKAENRNASNDTEDYFDYVMFAWGNCQAGDRLVMERKMKCFPTEADLSVDFTPGVRFFFKYDKIVSHPNATIEGVLPPKIKEEVILSDWVDEDGYLIRAAMLVFYKDPEKWVTGSYIKIGYFGKSDSDLVYQDEVHGPLIEQVDKTVDLVYTKYMKALIDYEGVQRIERFMFHKDAFREILLNAIVHKDYSSYNPIQISVYEDKIYIWNDGEMPPNLDSTDKMFMKHSSKPFNPKLANVFFKSGMIEA